MNKKNQGGFLWIDLLKIGNIAIGLNKFGVDPARLVATIIYIYPSAGSRISLAQYFDFVPLDQTIHVKIGSARPIAAG